MSVSDYYKQNCQLYSVSRTVDYGGAFSESYVKVADFMGRIRLLQGRERVINEKQGYESTHRIYCSKLLSVSLTDRVKNGQYTFDVVNVNYLNDEADHIEIDVKLVTEL
ncbi:MAG: head-tail adaptor protein [Ignavibacteria bacterium]|nr:head-tail adaptor protein [Ignavibacteria bacterium]